MKVGIHLFGNATQDRKLTIYFGDDARLLAM